MSDNLAPLTILGVLLAVFVAGWFAVSRTVNRSLGPREEDGPLPTVPRDLETRLWVLIRDQQYIPAVQMVRKEMKLDLRRSKLVVDDVARRLPAAIR